MRISKNKRHTHDNEDRPVPSRKMGALVLLASLAMTPITVNAEMNLYDASPVHLTIFNEIVDDTFKILDGDSEINVASDADNIEKVILSAYMNNDSISTETIQIQSLNYSDINMPTPKIEIVCDTTSVGRPSGATGEQLQQAIVNMGSWMADYNFGELFHQLENAYGVNAIFAIAVTTQEAGFRQSSVCRRNKNMFGITGKKGYRSFNSYEECIEYFYNLIRVSYINKGRYSTQSIGSKYCTTPTWGANVSKLMWKVYNNIEG